MSRTLESIPNARATDPESSHLAGDHVTLSGVRATQGQVVLQAVKQAPGRTSREISHPFGMSLDRYAVARRLADLEDMGLVYKGESKRCLIAGTMAVTWWPGAAPKPPVEAEQGQLL